MKNKFRLGIYDEYDQPPDIHLNLDIGDGWLVEVQLMFSSILAIKKELHTYYVVIRATKPSVMLATLFEKAPSLVDFKDEEIADLQKVIKTNEEMERKNVDAGIFSSPEAEIAYLRE